MSLTGAQRRFVRDRAGGCCEYCRTSVASGTVPFHVESRQALAEVYEYPCIEDEGTP